MTLSTAIRIVKTERCTLYCGDCLEVLPTLEAGSVDAVITDPPYGIGFKYDGHDDTPEGYGKWLWSVVEMSESKCRPGSPVFVFQAMLNCRRFSEWFPRDYRIFAACKNFVQMRPTEMQYAYDPVLVWWTDGERWSAGELSRDWYVANTSPSSRSGLNIVEGHPCPRPLDQMKLIVSQWVKPTGVILDPFTGSGTTGVAASILGRDFVGIEKHPPYFAIAQRRIEQAESQLALFTL